MRLIRSQETAGATVARLEQLIVAAGGHLWSDRAIKTYMKTERKKLKANWLYYFAKSIPFGRYLDPSERVDQFAMYVFLSLCASGVLSFVVTCFSAGFGWGITDTSAITMGVSFVTAATILGVMVWATDHKTKVVGPGHWMTIPFDRNTMHHALPVIKQVNRIKMFVPNARFEISLLYQDSWLLDPVLWIIVEDDGYITRRPFIVWDDHAKVVLPPT